jgi:nucleotide-binding universal stress UspA family protein
MTLATSIVCPVDFSPHAERALRHAAALAAHSGARLTVVAVNDPVLVAAASAAGHGATVRGQVETAIAEMLARMPRPTAAGEVAIDIATGAPPDEILAAATRANADLVVMGTRGLGGASKLMFGSTAERVLRAAPIPVLVVPDYSPERMSVEGDRARLTVHDVLAAIGFDPTDTAVAAVAGRWARDCGASLTLVHVCADAPAPSWWPFAADPAPDDRLDLAMQQLETLARTTEGAAPSALEVRRGAVDAALATLVQERGAGLIVISRGGGHHRLGATAYRVVTDARVPALVVPGPGGAAAAVAAS